jgi:hypothetical protein
MFSIVLILNFIWTRNLSWSRKTQKRQETHILSFYRYHLEFSQACKTYTCALSRWTLFIGMLALTLELQQIFTLWICIFPKVHNLNTSLTSNLFDNIAFIIRDLSNDLRILQPWISTWICPFYIQTLLVLLTHFATSWIYWSRRNPLHYQTHSITYRLKFDLIF